MVLKSKYITYLIYSIQHAIFARWNMRIGGPETFMLHLIFTFWEYKHSGDHASLEHLWSSDGFKFGQLKAHLFIQEAKACQRNSKLNFFHKLEIFMHFSLQPFKLSTRLLHHHKEENLLYTFSLIKHNIFVKLFFLKNLMKQINCSTLY